MNRSSVFDRDLVEVIIEHRFDSYAILRASLLNLKMLAHASDCVSVFFSQFTASQHDVHVFSSWTPVWLKTWMRWRRRAWSSCVVNFNLHWAQLASRTAAIVLQIVLIKIEHIFGSLVDDDDSAFAGETSVFMQWHEAERPLLKGRRQRFKSQLLRFSRRTIRRLDAVPDSWIWHFAIL